MDIEFLRAKQLLVDQMLIRSKRRFPKKTVLVVGKLRLTYEELNQRVENLAGWFQTKGIKKGDKVAVLLQNRVEYVESLFALGKIGAIMVPINFRLKESEILYILDNSDSKMLIIEKDFLSTIKTIRQELSKLNDIVVVGDDEKDHESYYYYQNIHLNTYVPELFELKDDDELLICYTSGTTGKPKGAVLTHKNMFLNAMNNALEYEMNKNDRQLLTTPLFHIGGISALTILMVMGGTTVLHKKFEPQSILETFEKEKITFAFMVPSMWNLLMEVPNFKQYDVSSMRVMCTAAASTPLELKKKMLSNFPNAGVLDTFGQTETSPCTTTLKPSDPLTKSGSVGTSYANVEIRVVDENMNDVSPGQVGEIIYRGPTTMKEYYKNPEATSETLKGGWLHSGDLVVVDEEGYISVVDRKKDMLISGGENIYPKEIEEVLYTHPAVLETAVIGVPDPKWGETVKAYIVLREGYEVTEQEIIDHCVGKIASYKKPRYVEFINELPRNAAGKVLKLELRNNNVNV